MRALLHGATCALLSLPLHAQSSGARVHWAPDGQEAPELVDLTGTQDDAVYALVKQKKDYLFHKVAADLHVVYAKPLTLEWDGHDLGLERVLVSSQRVAVFTSYYDTKHKQNHVLLSMYDATDLHPLGTMREVGHCAAPYPWNRGRFTARVSPDGQWMLFALTPPVDDEGHSNVELTVSDADGNAAWTRTEPVPADGNIEQYRVDNAGHALLGLLRFEGPGDRRDRKRDAKPDYTYHLLAYSNGSDAPVDKPLGGGRFLLELVVTPMANGDILCGGVYGDRGGWTVRGAYVIRLNGKELAVVHESYKELTQGPLALDFPVPPSALKYKKKEEPDRMLWDAEVRSFLPRDGGGTVFTVEQLRVFAVTYTAVGAQVGSSESMQVWHYMYGDMLVVDVDKDGEIRWTSQVPKCQHSTGDNAVHSGFARACKGGNSYLVFNDAKENTATHTARTTPVVETEKDGVTVLVSVDADGNATREPLFRAGDEAVRLVPKNAIGLANGDLFFQAERHNKECLGLVVLP